MSTAGKVHFIRQTEKYKAVNLSSLQRPLPLRSENLLLGRPWIHLFSGLTAGYLTSFVHVPKPVQDSVLCSPSQNTTEDKASDCFLTGSPAHRASVAWATCETSHFTSSYASCSRRHVGTGSPPSAAALPPLPCSKTRGWYFCSAGCKPSRTQPRAAGQEFEPRHHVAPCSGACLFSSGTPLAPSLTFPRLIPIPTHTLIWYLAFRFDWLSK